MKIVVCERFVNVQTSKQRGKKLAVGRGPLIAAGSSHGTTGTVVNPALQIGMLYYLLHIFNNKR